MLYSLLLTALLMGLAGLPHCAAMCAAPCAAGLPKGLPWQALCGRTLGYALLGAAAAGAAAGLSHWSRLVGVLQPLWVMALTAAALLGASMAVTGRMPAAIQRQGLAAYRRLSGLARGATGAREVTPWLLGLAWAALPCGLLYSAVVLATLAPSSGEGALVMAMFSLPGALALYGLPLGLGLWRRAPPAQARPGWLADTRWAMRCSGALLSAASAWALAHRLHDQWLIWCA
ncbi:MAG: sulfite exporter TauE/SafE family protein [Rubrivivax sp.]|nr:MAG: sulfite exporter TauE/SafE family protein [Rubrivivax sp.]